MTQADYVYELLKEKPMAFRDIVDILVKEKDFPMEKIGIFYSDLTLDGRFICLEGNVWDLRERQPFEKRFGHIEPDEDEEDDYDMDEDDDE